MNHKTIELRFLMSDPNIKPMLDKALSTYPIYEKRSKEEYIPSYIPTREELNKKILNAYKYREIGFETIARFIDELEIAMNEIMPYYNQLMFSADQDFNIIYNVDYVRKTDINRDKNSLNVVDEDKESSNTTKDNAKSTSTGTNKTSSSDKTSTDTTNTDYHKGVKSDTPQDELDIGAMEIDNLSYASESEFNRNQGNSKSSSTGEADSTTNTNVSGTNDSTSTSTSLLNGKTTSNGQDNEKEVQTETIKGNYGQVSAQSLIDRYRDTIVNIEQQIINDRRITELFMLVF